MKNKKFGSQFWLQNHYNMQKAFFKSKQRKNSVPFA